MVPLDQLRQGLLPFHLHSTGLALFATVPSGTEGAALGALLGLVASIAFFRRLGKGKEKGEAKPEPAPPLSADTCILCGAPLASPTAPCPNCTPASVMASSGAGGGPKVSGSSSEGGAGAPSAGSAPSAPVATGHASPSAPPPPFVDHDLPRSSKIAPMPPPVPQKAPGPTPESRTAAGRPISSHTPVAPPPEMEPPPPLPGRTSDDLEVDRTPVPPLPSPSAPAPFASLDPGPRFAPPSSAPPSPSPSGTAFLFPVSHQSLFENLVASSPPAPTTPSRGIAPPLTAPTVRFTATSVADAAPSTCLVCNGPLQGPRCPACNMTWRE